MAALRPVPTRAPGFPFTVSTAPYDAILRQLVAAHKERGALILTPFLAGRLAAAIEGVLLFTDSSASAVVLVPVPSARAAVRERGFDATWALARGLLGCSDGRRRSVPADCYTTYVRYVIRRGLSADQRATNLSGAFRVTSAASGPPVVVVDDVVTTGSSLTEAAALRQAGHYVVGAATVAATQRDRPVST